VEVTTAKLKLPRRSVKVPSRGLADVGPTCERDLQIDPGDTFNTGLTEWHTTPGGIVSLALRSKGY
jgi:hypothetical protein